jgi:hypothetical protein
VIRRSMERSHRHEYVRALKIRSSADREHLLAAVNPWRLAPRIMLLHHQSTIHERRP